ncbi:MULTISPECIES: mobilome CxxCx(11)CxxC protein [Pantoea]|uniref:mobilome CxxCx(11)CxxC protein n=1 Tax=Pantoea TaxID=53335 RepID=UPI00057F76FC|nr:MULTISPECIES: mobilome CxxCx(11)CxxC protein [Pantoea]
MNQRILQIRTDALVAEYLYTDKLKSIGYLSITITCLTLLVPVLFSAAAFLAKGTSLESWMNIVSVILSAILVSLSIFSLIFKIDQKRESCLIGRRMNIDVSSDALDLLHKNDLELEWFYKYIAKMDSTDQENISDTSDKKRKRAYIYSLKKLFPGRSDTVCSFCNASPFSFKKGSCQVCGNTPKGVV